MVGEKITKKDIEHLKHLARVEFYEKEADELVEDLERILEYVATLKEVDVLNVSEMTHAADLKNVFRKDENSPLAGKGFDEELIGHLISAFPEKEKTYLKVKAVQKR